MSILVDRRKMSKGWNHFDIMHKDCRVARIYENGKCEVHDSLFMPYNLYFEESDDIDERVNNLSNFYYWCSSRVLTLDRKYAKEILTDIGANQAVTDRERAMIAASYHGLSLTDVYWIQSAGESLSFDAVNLYQHSLANAFTDVSLRGKAMTIQNAELAEPGTAAGDVSVQGVAPKAWVRENGKIYLLKDGNEEEVEAELLASRIANCFDVNHVEYVADMFDGTKVSKCELITSEDRSIVPFEYIAIYCDNNDLDKYEFVRHKDNYSYNMMNILDYLLGNTDRHWGNWGFYADNSTNELLGLYPLMDWNKAFRAYESLEGDVCQTTAQRMTQREAAIQAVQQTGLNQIAPVPEDWFPNPALQDMFFRRLAELKPYEPKIN